MEPAEDADAEFKSIQRHADEVDSSGLAVRLLEKVEDTSIRLKFSDETPQLVYRTLINCLRSNPRFLTEHQWIVATYVLPTLARTIGAPELHEDESVFLLPIYQASRDYLVDYSYPGLEV